MNCKKCKQHIRIDFKIVIIGFFYPLCKGCGTENEFIKQNSIDTMMKGK
jgi:hypothetical protein